MEEIARVYADALFGVAKQNGKLDAIRDQLGVFAEAVAANHDLQVFFFSPYVSTADKRDGIKRAIVGAEPELTNFLELLIEKHRMPVIFRVRAIVASCRARPSSTFASGSGMTCSTHQE